MTPDRPLPGPAFSVEMPIRFSHSDPAGIVYYPNYFDMFNAVIEDWFTAALEVDYPRQVFERRLGFPTVHAACDFFAPSRMGDRLTYTLRLREIGRTSFRLAIHGHAHGQERLRADLVLVVISLDTNRAVPIPDDLRRRFEAYRAAGQDWRPPFTESPRA